METFIKKITSRKFLLSTVGLVASLALMLGADAGEIETRASGFLAPWAVLSPSAVQNAKLMLQL